NTARDWKRTLSPRERALRLTAFAAAVQGNTINQLSEQALVGSLRLLGNTDAELRTFARTTLIEQFSNEHSRSSEVVSAIPGVELQLAKFALASRETQGALRLTFFTDRGDSRRYTVIPDQSDSNNSVDFDPSSLRVGVSTTSLNSPGKILQILDSYQQTLNESDSGLEQKAKEMVAKRIVDEQKWEELKPKLIAGGTVFALLLLTYGLSQAIPWGIRQFNSEQARQEAERQQRAALFTMILGACRNTDYSNAVNAWDAQVDLQDIPSLQSWDTVQERLGNGFAIREVDETTAVICSRGWGLRITAQPGTKSIDALSSLTTSLRTGNSFVDAVRESGITLGIASLEDEKVSAGVKLINDLPAGKTIAFVVPERPALAVDTGMALANDTSPITSAIVFTREADGNVVVRRVPVSLEGSVESPDKVLTFSGATVNFNTSTNNTSRIGEVVPSAQIPLSEIISLDNNTQAMLLLHLAFLNSPGGAQSPSTWTQSPPAEAALSEIAYLLIPSQVRSIPTLDQASYMLSMLSLTGGGWTTQKQWSTPPAYIEPQSNGRIDPPTTTYQGGIQQHHQPDRRSLAQQQVPHYRYRG
ncbi:MAG: hypothetical protein WCP97_08660, partial [bacterium]